MCGTKCPKIIGGLILLALLDQFGYLSLSSRLPVGMWTITIGAIVLAVGYNMFFGCKKAPEQAHLAPETVSAVQKAVVKKSAKKTAKKKPAKKKPAKKKPAKKKPAKKKSKRKKK